MIGEQLTVHDRMMAELCAVIEDVPWAPTVAAWVTNDVTRDEWLASLLRSQDTTALVVLAAGALQALPRLRSLAAYLADTAQGRERLQTWALTAARVESE